MKISHKLPQSYYIICLKFHWNEPQRYLKSNSRVFQWAVHKSLVISLIHFQETSNCSCLTSCQQTTKLRWVCCSSIRFCPTFAGRVGLAHADSAAKQPTTGWDTPLDVFKDTWWCFQMFFVPTKMYFSSREAGPSPSVIILTKTCILSQTMTFTHLKMQQQEGRFSFCPT